MSHEVYAVTNSFADERKFAGQTVLTYRIEYPQFVSYTPMESLRRINAEYRQQAQYLAHTIQATYYSDAVADYQTHRDQGLPFSPYEFLRTFEITYGQNCVLSLYFDEYQYTGGAHGNTLRTSDTWNALTAQRIPLSALFQPGTYYVGALENAIVAEIDLRNALQPNTYFDDSQALVRQYFNPESFYLTPEALVIYFQQAEIAPYATGIPTFPIPYAQVGARIPGC